MAQLRVVVLYKDGRRTRVYILKRQGIYYGTGAPVVIGYPGFIESHYYLHVGDL